MSERNNLPVIIYDSRSNKAGVLMSLDYFENNFQEFDTEIESNEENIDVSKSLHPIERLDELEELEDSIEQEIDDLEQTNEELALWKAKREEKEREEIEKTLEEELLENPPPDPFEEDFLHTPEWHKASDIEEFIEEKKEIPLPKEPSYHPVANMNNALSWTDWTFTGNSFTPISQNILESLPLDESESDLYTEETAEDPIFLEEPV